MNRLLPFTFAGSAMGAELCDDNRRRVDRLEAELRNLETNRLEGSNMSELDRLRFQEYVRERLSKLVPAIRHADFLGQELARSHSAAGRIQLMVVEPIPEKEILKAGPTWEPFYHALFEERLQIPSIHCRAWKMADSQPEAESMGMAYNEVMRGEIAKRHGADVFDPLKAEAKRRWEQSQQISSSVPFEVWSIWLYPLVLVVGGTVLLMVRRRDRVQPASTV